MEHADHIILETGRNRRCACGEFASRFMRCRTRRCVLAWCAACSPRDLRAARDDHEIAHG